MTNSFSEASSKETQFVLKNIIIKQAQNEKLRHSNTEKLQKNKTEKNKAEEKGISAEMKKHTQSYARKTQN